MPKNSIVIAVVILALIGGSYLLGRNSSVKSTEISTKKENAQKTADNTIKPSVASRSANGKILFITSGSVHSIDPDGKNEKALTTGSKYLKYVRLAWSPDRKKILYNETSDNSGEKSDSLKILDIENDKEITVEGNFDVPVRFGEWHWLPGGSKIIYSKSDGKTIMGSAVYVADADGSNITKIVPCVIGNSEDNFIHFLSDGKKFTYLDDAEGISMASIDDVQKTKLVKKDTPYGFDIPVASLSPDGSKLAYAIGSDHSLHVIDINNGNKTDFKGTADSRFIEWSPDSKKFAGNDGIIDVTSGKETALKMKAMGWYPSSDEVYYLDDYNRLFVVNADGTGNKKIADAGTDGWESLISLSPDAKKIVYATAGDNLFVANADGSDPVQITQAGGCQRPFWVAQ